GRLQRLLQAACMIFPRFGMRMVASLAGDRRKAAQRAGKEPAEPDARAAAGFADAVHAVVPVAAEDERQAVLPCPQDRKIERAGAMVVERGILGRAARLEEGIVLAFGKRLAL